MPSPSPIGRAGVPPTDPSPAGGVKLRNVVAGRSDGLESVSGKRSWPDLAMRGCIGGRDNSGRILWHLVLVSWYAFLELT